MRWALPLLLTALLAAAEWPPRVAVEGRELPLLGAARFTWWGIEVYDAALYLPTGAAPLDPVPTRIVFRYRRAFSADELARATTATVRERARGADPAEIEAALALINRLWPPVQRGDELALQRLPGQGVLVLRNGQALGLVPGEAFARVLFSVWLGDEPIDRRLRDRLLARR